MDTSARASTSSSGRSLERDSRTLSLASSQSLNRENNAGELEFSADLTVLDPARDPRGVLAVLLGTADRAAPPGAASEDSSRRDESEAKSSGIPAYLQPRKYLSTPPCLIETHRREKHEPPIVAPGSRASVWSSQVTSLGADLGASGETVDASTIPGPAYKVLLSVSSGASFVSKMVLGLRRAWGTEWGLAGFHARTPSRRTSALLGSLLSYHDPLLYASLDELSPVSGDAQIRWWATLPSLFGMYREANALWDAAVARTLAGFESPVCGSVFFALGVLITGREELLTGSDEEAVRERIEALAFTAKDNEAMTRAMRVGSRAAAETPRDFLRLVGEAEIDARAFKVRTDVVLTAINVSKAGEAEMMRSKQSKPAKLIETAPSFTAEKPSLWSRFVAAATQSLIPARKPSFPANDLAPSSRVSIDSASTSSQTEKELQLYLVEYAGRGSLGLQLVTIPGIGLTVNDFERRDGEPGEAESEGSVALGDVFMSCNGVSLNFLSPQAAARVIQTQTRPLICVFSTSRSQAADEGPKWRVRLGTELAARQEAVFKQRLVEFYIRNGAGPERLSRIDGLLGLFAAREVELMRILRDKYGDALPGDPSVSPEWTTHSASELAQILLDSTKRRAVSLTARASTTLVIDVRSKLERAQTGVFPSVLLLGPDELEVGGLGLVLARVASCSVAPKVVLMASGKHRAWSLGEPLKAERERRWEADTIRLILGCLRARGVPHVSVAEGGMLECFRRLRLRLGGYVASLSGVGGGPLRNACEWYANLEYDDSASVAKYVMAMQAKFKNRPRATLVPKKSTPRKSSGDDAAAKKA